jgi:hypothetical protein
MASANFTAQGTRWRVVPINSVAETRDHVPPLPGPGLLFTSPDAETRFLLLDSETVSSAEYLEAKSVAELSALVRLAKPLQR